MKAETIYLDYNATSPLHPKVREAMLEVMDAPCNASSVHSVGRHARRLLSQARETIATSVSAWPQEVTFTASGTEANNMALRQAGERPILVGATEHSSLLAKAKLVGGDVLPVDGNGMLDQDVLRAKLKALGKPAFISVMLVNNETGVIQPVAEIVKIAKEFDALIHCDAVQAYGKIPVDMGLLGVDMLTICAHKNGGPIGVGALIAKEKIQLTPLLYGGAQENGRRSGTENIPAIVGMAAMTQHVGTSWLAPLEQALRSMEETIMKTAPDAVIVGRRVKRLGNVSKIVMPNVPHDTQLMTFDLDNVCVSAGSACASGRIEPSHVLRAMGFTPSVADCCIRISGGWDTKPEDIALFMDLWLRAYKRLSKKAA